MKYKRIIATLFILGCLTVIPTFADDMTEAKLEYNKGIDFYKIGQYDRSMDAFRKAINLDPEYIDAYYNLGSILEYLEQYEAALTVFKQIIVRKPTDYDAVYKAAMLSNKLGYTDKAKSYLALIPANSYINPQIEKLAKEMNTDLQTIKYEQSQVSKQPAPQSNGIYENIASPTGITTDNEGNVFVAGFSDNVIYKLTPEGQRIIYLKDKQLNGPIGLAGDEKGNIYVANYNANNVLKIEKNGNISVLIENIQKPYSLHLTNGVLLISSQGSNAVVRFKLN